MTACSFAVWAHVFWNWGARSGTDRHPLFILGRMLSTLQRSLVMRRLGFIRKARRTFVATTRRVDIEAFVAARSHVAEKMNHGKGLVRVAPFNTGSWGQTGLSSLRANQAIY